MVEEGTSSETLRLIGILRSGEGKLEESIQMLQHALDTNEGLSLLEKRTIQVQFIECPGLAGNQDAK